MDKESVTLRASYADTQMTVDSRDYHYQSLRPRFFQSAQEASSEINIGLKGASHRLDLAFEDGFVVMLFGGLYGELSTPGEILVPNCHFLTSLRRGRYAD